MRRANISEVAEFVAVAEHLERRGWIAEADAGYCIFVLTPEGLDDEAQNQRMAGRRVSCGRRARVL